MVRALYHIGYIDIDILAIYYIFHFGESILQTMHFCLELGYFTIFGVLKFLKSEEAQLKPVNMVKMT